LETISNCQLRSIEYLNVSTLDVYDSFLNMLPQLPNLKKINLAKCYHIQGGFASLSVLTKLEFLNLRKCMIRDSSARGLSTLTNLEFLVFGKMFEYN